ncbi:helix-turn-helix domain-containing protein [Geomonas azotofigens]|uniref:helix-turn-helix domain-containing protein n=1 Tax=Geomonas azotofigens TaxID=2843196 RepID=UPI001C0F612B|nr:helix-turn-helix domain-containing protein [Geomonas azotofigens]MBU5613420.1 helix-turn-helix domain-containing protein [Geomonas azotofigens]
MAEPEVESGEEVPVGEYLRRVREAKGLQLEEASRVTKIGKNYLAAIEQGEFQKLPNAAYIKGFLRLYAGFLSLSGDEVVARYERGLTPPSGAQPEASAPRAAHAPQAQGMAPQTGIDTLERAKIRAPGRWIVPALLLGAVVVAALFFTEGEPPRVQPPPSAPAPAAPPAPAPAAQPVQKPMSSARNEAAAPLPAGTANAPSTPAGKQAGVVLKLRFNRDSWLSITIDDSITQRYDLKAGDLIEWKGQRSFALDLGDGGAVEAEFNGRPLKPLGEAGKPAHVELKGDQAAP